jgi:hypothetical protein
VKKPHDRPRQQLLRLKLTPADLSLLATPSSYPAIEYRPSPSRACRCRPRAGDQRVTKLANDSSTLGGRRVRRRVRHDAGNVRVGRAAAATFSATCIATRRAVIRTAGLPRPFTLSHRCRRQRPLTRSASRCGFAFAHCENASRVTFLRAVRA